MTRILHVLSDDTRRGAQVFGWTLAQRLDELGLTNTCVALVGSGGEGLPVESLGSTARGLATLLTLRTRMGNADITVAHGSSTLQACAIAGVGPGRKFVYRQISDPVYWSQGTARRLRTRAFYRLPNHIVSLSERTKAVLSSRFSIDADRVAVIPNAADERAFTPAGPTERHDARSALGIPDDRAVVGFVGALVEEKGVVDLVEAMRPRQVLLMAGVGPAAARVRERARERSVDLRLVGPVADPRSIYVASDVLVLPSWSEQQPGVVLEATLVGTPIVATRVGLLDELVLEGSTGLLTQPQDPVALAAAIDRALAQSADSTAMTDAARQHTLAHFSMERASRSWFRLLEDLTS